MARIKIEELPVMEEMKDEELKGIFGGTAPTSTEGTRRIFLSAATLFGATAPGLSGGTINISGGTIFGNTPNITGGRIK